MNNLTVSAQLRKQRNRFGRIYSVDEIHSKVDYDLTHLDDQEELPAEVQLSGSSPSVRCKRLLFRERRSTDTA